jgi:hypothetical protein
MFLAKSPETKPIDPLSIDPDKAHNKNIERRTSGTTQAIDVRLLISPIIENVAAAKKRPRNKTAPEYVSAVVTAWLIVIKPRYENTATSKRRFFSALPDISEP